MDFVRLRMNIPNSFLASVPRSQSHPYRTPAAAIQPAHLVVSSPSSGASTAHPVGPSLQGPLGHRMPVPPGGCIQLFVNRNYNCLPSGSGNGGPVPPSGPRSMPVGNYGGPIRYGGRGGFRGNNDEGEYSRKRKILVNEDDIVLLKKKVQGMKEAMQDFGKLLASGEDSDVTVQVGGAEFRVHRFILCARSPVFSVMFRHNTAERASNKVIIEDCEPEVFKEFLHYLYTGFARSLTKQNVFGLYRVADKYLADNLKQHCLAYIQRTLSVQTFCSAVQLALTHMESGLLDQAYTFAAKNIQSIVCTVEWQDFICEYPNEANEVLIKALGSQTDQNDAIA